jgi:Mrp family chromosome partitioning ATPase
VIFDTPPVNAVTDASVLAASADAVLLVVESRRTTYPALNHARESIERVGGHIVGAIVNKVRTDGAHAYYGAYYYDSYGMDQPGKRRRSKGASSNGRPATTAEAPTSGAPSRTG